MKNKFLTVFFVALSLPIAADYKNNRFESAQEHESRRKEEKEFARDEHAKQQFLAKLLAGLGIGIVGGYLSQRKCLEGTGADVGLVVSTILMSLSCLVDGENAKALRGMAIAATPLSMMGVALSSDAVSGQKGLLATYGYLGIDKLFKNTTGNSKHGLLTLLSISAYIAAKPVINEATSIAEDACSSHFEKAKNWYHAKRK